ncbi:MAG: MFS transporter [Rhodoferax sp.]|nr:MFS transporter [Rhodoferax sp.]
MNRNLWLLALAQGLFLTNNVTLIAINGLVGLALAPLAWMATLPVMGYVVGAALSTGLVARAQARFGRKVSFQLGLLVALLTAGLGAWAVLDKSFWLLLTATVVAGYYSANAQLYRFAAVELCTPDYREKAVSLVMAGGLMGAVVGPNLALRTKNLLAVDFAGAYAALALVAVLSLVTVSLIRFAPLPKHDEAAPQGRPLGVLVRQPVFLVALLCSALSYGVMNLLMAATPLAMQTCGLPFSSAAWVLEWHVIGMFAPGFFTGSFIKRFGAVPVMGAGVLLNLACIGVALTGQEPQHFLIALFMLGVGWNFLFTGSTTLAIQGYRPEEKNRAQALVNFCMFATMAFTSFASGALVTTQGWNWLNIGSLIPVLAMAAGLLWLYLQRSGSAPAVAH